MRMIKPIIKIATITLIVVFIASYSLYESRNLIIGPVIEIFSPLDGSATDTALIEIKGLARNISSISLNDRKITVDNKGIFSEKMLLSPGYNIIKLTVADKFGRSKEKKLELVLTEHEPLVLTESQEELN